MPQSQSAPQLPALVCVLATAVGVALASDAADVNTALRGMLEKNAGNTKATPPAPSPWLPRHKFDTFGRTIRSAFIHSRSQSMPGTAFNKKVVDSWNPHVASIDTTTFPKLSGLDAMHP